MKLVAVAKYTPLLTKTLIYIIRCCFCVNFNSTSKQNLIPNFSSNDSIRPF